MSEVNMFNNGDRVQLIDLSPYPGELGIIISKDTRWWENQLIDPNVYNYVAIKFDDSDIGELGIDIKYVKRCVI